MGSLGIHSDWYEGYGYGMNLPPRHYLLQSPLHPAYIVYGRYAVLSVGAYPAPPASFFTHTPGEAERRRTEETNCATIVRLSVLEIYEFLANFMMWHFMMTYD